MAKPAAGSRPEFITSTVAKREYGVPPSCLSRAALLGRLAFELPPGLSPRYERAGVALLGEEKKARAERRAERAKKAATKAG